MKNFFLFAIAALLMSSCDQDGTTADSSFDMQPSGADYVVPAMTPQIVSANITAGAHWTNDRVWVLDGVVVVTGGTLLIDPGTFIVAAPGTEGVLVIGKNAKIDARGVNTDGTCNPIVFTSYNLVDNNPATTALPGQFGGVILLGDAPVNTGSVTNVIEGLTDYLPQSDLYFGGSNSAHDAGTMSYVRIEFAGRRIGTEDAGNEVNGLTFGAVGNLTDIDHVQVSYGLDDGFEWFGGTVNATHLVAFGCDDDSFDFDWGYTGSVTKAISIANANTTHSQSGGSPDSNGIELDNNAGGVPGTPSTLITRPIITDMSIVGFKTAPPATPATANLENGIHVRRLGQISLTRVTVTGYNTGIRWDVNPTLSSKSALSVHGFTNVVLPAPPSPYTQLQLLGAFPNMSTAASAPTWGSLPYQPFYNPLASFNLASGTTGAFASEANWTNCWTKFSGFVTVYE